MFQVAKLSTYNWQKFGSRIASDLMSYNEAGHYTQEKEKWTDKYDKWWAELTNKNTWIVMDNQ